MRRLDNFDIIYRQIKETYVLRKNEINVRRKIIATKVMEMVAVNKKTKNKIIEETVKKWRLRDDADCSPTLMKEIIFLCEIFDECLKARSFHYTRGVGLKEEF